MSTLTDDTYAYPGLDKSPMQVGSVWYCEGDPSDPDSWWLGPKASAEEILNDPELHHSDEVTVIEMRFVGAVSQITDVPADAVAFQVASAGIVFSQLEVYGLADGMGFESRESLSKEVAQWEEDEDEPGSLSIACFSVVSATEYERTLVKKRAPRESGSSASAPSC